MSIFTSIKLWAKKIKRDAVMLWFTQRHPDTPIVAKVLCIFTVAYALSPIDLIPDFIPILGYLDEVILLPLFIWWAVKLLPSHVVKDCRIEAENWISSEKSKPTSYIGGIVIVLVWIAVLYLFWHYTRGFW